MSDPGDLVDRVKAGDVAAVDEILATGGRFAVPALEGVIRRARGVFRVRVAVALHAFSGDPGYAWPIVESLERDDVDGRVAAAVALAAFPGDIARTALATAASTDPVDAVRVAASASLATMA